MYAHYEVCKMLKTNTEITQYFICVRIVKIDSDSNTKTA